MWGTNGVYPFVASLCVANPNWNSLKEDPNSYDAVSVLKGLRPVGLLPSRYCQTNQSFNSYLLKALRNAGFEVCQNPHSKDVVIGEKARVDCVLSIIKEQAMTRAFSSDYHRKLGEALGYSTEAIRRFIDSLARGELGLDVSIMATAFPAEDESSLRISLPSGRAVVLR